MNQKRHKRLYLTIGGALVGIINGMLGSGGGMIAVPMFRHIGIEQKKCHATAILLIFFLSLFSAILYLMDGRLQLSSVLPYLPGGIIGAIIGAVFLKKIPNHILSRVFGIFMIYTGLRLLLK